MKIIFILGGDGYCGWPLSLKLASNGNKVIILDNLVRRSIDKELNIQSLTPISQINKRILAAKEHFLDISFVNIDISSENTKLGKLLSKYKPQFVINMAHQRSVPYSSIDFNKASWTIENTLKGQFSLLEAVKNNSSSTKVIHLGSLGVFGYRYIKGGMPIAPIDTCYYLENNNTYLTKSQIPFSPDSIYHLSKSINSQVNEYYSRVFNMDITDVYQATVWGCQVDDFDDRRLLNRFDYDPIYGTVINRFCYQAINNEKLTVYGVGNQERGFIHIKNSTERIANLIEKEWKPKSEVTIKALVSETLSIKKIAESISYIFKNGIKYIENPRIERETRFSLKLSEVNSNSRNIIDKTSIKELGLFIRKELYYSQGQRDKVN